MKSIICSILLFCFGLLPQVLYAQQQLKGVVTDGKESLIGVAVFWQNKDGRTLHGTTTNENGEYVLPLPFNGMPYNVVFSFIGMETQTIRYSNQKILNIKLVDASTMMDEVMIVEKAEDRDHMGIVAKNTGVARQKIELTDMQDMSVTSVEDMLQGKLTNVDIIASSGDPGSKMQIRIRGTSSLNASNEPLIVIDDVPFSTDISDDFDFGTANVEDFGALVNISPTDIESIEVLKDAAATALWGSQAANGVLLIKTIRGTKSKPTFSITEKVSTSWEPKSIEMLNADEYVTLMQDALWNRVQYRGFQPQDMKLLTDFNDIRFNPSYEYYNEFNVNTDWLSHLTQKPINSETTFAMRGGGDFARYSFSVGYTTDKGTTIGTEYQRITARLNLDYDFSKKFKVASSFSYVEGNKNEPYLKSSSPRGIALSKMPNMSPWVLDANGNPTDVYFTQPSTCIQGLKPNPVAAVYDSKANTINRGVNAAFNISYVIFNGLTFRTNIAFGLNSIKSKSFYPEQVSGVKWASDEYNLVSDGTQSSVTIFNKSTLVYSRSFGKSYFTATAMMDAKETNSSGYSASVAGIGSGEVADPSANGKVVKLSSADSKTRSTGYVGKLYWRWDQRFSVGAGLRSDASSKTGRNSRWGTFTSADAQWTVSNEPFLKNTSWLDDLRLNFSWGQSGNAPSGSFTYVGTLGPEDAYMGNSAIKPNSMQLNKLKWETTTSYNYGIRFATKQDRINIDFNYYIKQTDNLLQRNMKISSTTGYSNVGYYNSGKTQNKGWELTLNFNKIIDINKFSISVTNLNISRNRNTVLKLPSNRVEESASESNGSYANRIVEGKPLGSFYGYQCLGVYQNTNETYARNKDGQTMYDVYGNNVTTQIFGKKKVYPGDAKYADKNYDGLINKYDMVYLGNSMPILTGGGSIRIAYASLSLRASFHYRLGQKVINRTRINNEAMFNGDNQRKSVLKRWRYEGDDTDIPRALYQEGYNHLGSDRFVEDNSFLKCKDITLNYKFPRTMLKRIGFTNGSIYVTTYNLFTITKYKGQDPETSLPSGFSQLAEDNSLTPRARRMALGVSFDF